MLTSLSLIILNSNEQNEPFEKLWSVNSRSYKGESLKSSNSTEVKRDASVLVGAAIGAILGLVAYVNNWLG